MNALEKRKNYDPWKDFFTWEDFFPKDLSRNGHWPAVNISEDDTSYQVDVVAPGFKKEDFKISVDEDVLTISAESKKESEEQDKKKTYSRREYSYSAFTRSFRLPENSKDDSIAATYLDGVLKLTVPKSEQQVKASKQIQVQ
ncbi:heat-shock protein Hsp20 [Chitinophaga caeni]|uniref:Heat-shock protein Hsp20 n=1 Tax=Chitinophaga caeni TaxID=2029983 RepID=A0A291QZC0_9BACT|nr:Hsp20/alpha crystallin family protein [Chitinophaga caeni]ATL49193.1 heat-shock protein Hsp20 [Chitinophaga caeni]